MSRSEVDTRIVAIVGSRKFGDEKMVRRFAYEMAAFADVIVTGGAPGADFWVQDEVENRKGIEIARLEVIEPDYEKFGRYLAPKHRNWEIARRCHELYAFWDGFSGGTAHVVTCAEALGKRVVVRRMRITVHQLQTALEQSLAQAGQTQ